MKKIFFGSLLFAALFTACSSDDYNAGIASPQSSDPTVPQSFGNGSVTEVGTINLAEITEENVKVATIVAPTPTSTTAKLDSMYITINDESSANVLVSPIKADGLFAASELEALIEATYGKRPDERTFYAIISAYMSDGTQAFLINSGVFNVKVKSIYPEVASAYTLTMPDGSTYTVTNDGSDPYVNSTFNCRIPAPEGTGPIVLKLVSADGQYMVNGAEENTFEYTKSEGSLTIPASEGAVYYDLFFDVLYKTYQVNPLFIDIEQCYYFTGTLNGWNNTNTDYKLTNDGSDPYSNPTFTCRIPAPEDGGDIEFKMTPESGLGGDWSKCLAAGSTNGTFVYNNGGGNLYINAIPGAKFYDLTFNMMELTWSYQAVTYSDYIYLACDYNGWSTSASPLIHLGDGVYEGFYYIQEADESSTWGFKFVIDGTWCGGNHAVATAGAFTPGSGDNLNTSTGFYQVKVNQADNSYSLTAVNTISLIGSAVNGDSSWGTDADMTFDSAEGCWIYQGALTAGEFKFRMNHDWSISWGGTDFDNLTNQNGANLKLAEGGNYLVKFKPNCNGQGSYSITPAN